MKPDEFEKLFKNVPEHAPDPKLMAELEEEFAWMDDADDSNDDISKANRPNIAINKIVPSDNNPQKEFASESFNVLCESVKAQRNVTVPLIVRHIGNDDEEKYEIIDGERRFKAAQKAGLPYVSCHVVTVDDGQASLMRIVANLQRKELGAMEFSLGLNATIKENPEINESELAKQLGMSASRFSNAKHLSIKIPKKIHKYFIEPNKKGKALTQKHGEMLYPLVAKVEAKEIAGKVLSQLATEAYEAGMGTAELNKRVKSLLGQSKPSVLSASTQTALTNLDTRHGKKVRLNLTGKKADIKIDFSALEPDEDIGSLMADIEAILTTHVGELASISTEEDTDTNDEDNAEQEETSTTVIEPDVPICADCGAKHDLDGRILISGQYYCGICSAFCNQCGKPTLKANATEEKSKHGNAMLHYCSDCR